MGKRINENDLKLMVRIARENPNTTNKELASMMNFAGLKAPTGKKINNIFVCNFRRRYAQEIAEATRAPVETNDLTTVDKLGILIVSSGLPKREKLELLEAIL